MTIAPYLYLYNFLFTLFKLLLKTSNFLCTFLTIPVHSVSVVHQIETQHNMLPFSSFDGDFGFSDGIQVTLNFFTNHVHFGLLLLYFGASDFYYLIVQSSQSYNHHQCIVLMLCGLMCYIYYWDDNQL